MDNAWKSYIVKRRKYKIINYFTQKEICKTDYQSIRTRGESTYKIYDAQDTG